MVQATSGAEIMYARIYWVGYRIRIIHVFVDAKLVDVKLRIELGEVHIRIRESGVG